MGIKTSLHSAFAIDSNKEEQGVWHDFNDNIRLKIRRISSDASQAARREAEKPFSFELQKKKLDPQVAEKILIEQIARGVIADWEGIINEEDGSELPYSPDVAAEILSAPELADFRGEILSLSLQKDHYKLERDKAALGN